MKPTGSRSHEGARPKKSLAILYLQSAGGSREDEYFRDGVTEDIIVELTKIRGLVLRPISAVRPYRDKPVPAIQAGRELDVSYVLEGTLRRSKQRVRVAVQLIETATSHTLWAESYDREVQDIFSIQDEIARSIARKLQVMLTDAESRAISKVPTASVEAYDHYLRGRECFRFFRRKSISFARQIFDRAIAIDPAYAGAYAGLADSYSYLFMFWDSSDENLRGADRASSKAIELDPDLAEAHVARGVAMSIAKNYDEADREFRAAIRLNPSLFEAYYFYARGYYARGMLDRAVYWFRRAGEVRPEDYQSPTLLGSALRGLGLRGESDVAYRKSVDRATRHLEVNPGDTRALYFSAISLAQLGERADEALALAEKALAIDPEEPQVLYNVGCFYALRGLNEKAIDCLAKTIAHGEWWRDWMRNDPDLESLHDEAAFRELVSPEDAREGS